MKRLWHRGCRSLVSTPDRQFERGDDHRAAGLGNLNGVAHMIAMTVRHEDIIGSNQCRIGRRFGVAGDEGVNQDSFTAGFDQKRRVR